jgi:hypothetical protein
MIAFVVLAMATAAPTDAETVLSTVLAKYAKASSYEVEYIRNCVDSGTAGEVGKPETRFKMTLVRGFGWIARDAGSMVQMPSLVWQKSGQDTYVVSNGSKCSTRGMALAVERYTIVMPGMLTSSRNRTAMPPKGAVYGKISSWDGSPAVEIVCRPPLVENIKIRGADGKTAVVQGHRPQTIVFLDAAKRKIVGIRQISQFPGGKKLTEEGVFRNERLNAAAAKDLDRLIQEAEHTVKVDRS